MTTPITPPIDTCLMFAERQITTEAAYRKFHAERLERLGITPAMQTEPLAAGLDSGAWLAWCECGAGVGIDPRWAFAGCSCGRTWEAIAWPAPALLAAIDAVLRLRPPGRIRGHARRFYSWRPTETVAELVDENRRRGWPMPEEPV
jgi:hypothetical protein